MMLLTQYLPIKATKVGKVTSALPNFSYWRPVDVQSVPNQMFSNIDIAFIKGSPNCEVCEITCCYQLKRNIVFGISKKYINMYCICKQFSLPWFTTLILPIINQNAIPKINSTVR